MARDASIDLVGFPELARLAEEVRASRRKCVLRRDGENIAMLAPLPAVRRRATARRPARTDAALAVVERTAGMFRDAARTPPATIAEETTAFEQGVADEAGQGSGV
jgi:hypothetical protein